MERLKAKHGFPWKFNGLKKEYWTAILTISTLNILLFIVNLTDMRFVWLDYSAHSAAALRQFVHQGTYMLVLAILMAMAVLLFFFRKNLNFYPSNDVLKQLAYLWIVQNGILAASVAMRNYHYITHHGLAYKRLGVIIFLFLVVIGLITFYWKIKMKMSLYYLLLANSWAAYFALLSCGMVNWDNFITNYNLNAQTPTEIDAGFLVYHVSDKNLPILMANKDKLLRKGNLKINILEEGLERKLRKFERRMQKQSWLSWNVVDWKNEKLLE